jgi:catechol-2,3-dioxygenase
MNDQTASARIVHVALFTRNPRELAPFYRDAFHMKIVHVGGAVQLWDGHVLLALNPWRGVDPETLRIDEVGEPQAKGFDHFGFQIDNLKNIEGRLKNAGAAADISKRPAGRTFTEWRAHDLEGNRIDLSEHGYKPVSAEKLQALEVEAASEINRLVIGAAQPAALAQFYQSAFGMTVLRQQNGKFTLSDGRTQLLLLPHDSASAEGFHCLGFRLVDQAQMLASAERMGATVARAPDWEDSAKEQFLLRDPDGNQLALFQDGA